MKSMDFSTLALFWNCMLLFDFFGGYPIYVLAIFLAQA
jgi:hypothetical protein